MALLPDEQDGTYVMTSPPNKAYDAALVRLVRGGLSDSYLNQYFRGQNLLYSKQIYIPRISAEEAPKAFNLSDQVKGRRWVIIYRGKVTPPVSGRFRFAGFSDDILVVRFNGKIVLDAGLAGTTGNKAREKDFYQNEGMPKVFHTYFGDTFTVKAGSAYSIEVMIGERPGGHFSAALLLEKIGVDYEKDGNGAPKLPIFKLGASEMPQQGQNIPVAAPDTSWSIWKDRNTLGVN
jgi:hypothetical protein